MAASRTLSAHAVLCDMDGTIVDSTAVVEQVWGVFAAEYGLSLDAILSNAHGRLTEETVAEHGPAGIDVEGVSAQLAKLELEAVDGIVEIPGATNFMAQLVDAGVVALVTSAPRDLAIMRMAAAGIPFPRVSVCADDVDLGKPNPECYLKAAAEMGVDPVDAIVFEDAAAGVAAGLAAGCQVVVVGALDDPITEGLPRIPDFRAVACEVGPEITFRF